MEQIPSSPRVYSTLMLTVGSEGTYYWLVTDQQFDLLEVCPEVVLGKYVAITSIDSGPLTPTDEELRAGWEAHEKIAYSPKIEHATDLPRSGWDEWYIFSTPTDLGISHLAENIFEVPQQQGHLSVFVNYCLALHQPEMKDLIDMFWRQIARVRPESYLADNDNLNFVTMNRSLFAKVRDAVKKMEG